MMGANGEQLTIRAFVAYVWGNYPAFYCGWVLGAGLTVLLFVVFT